MNWIKNRFDQLILAVLAVALLAFAVMVLAKAGRFEEQFSEVTKPAIIHTPEGLEPMQPVSLTSPVWNEAANPDGSERGSLFVSRPYILMGGEPRPPEFGYRTDSLTKKLIPNQWFMKHRLPWTEGTVTLQDPDKDGFANEDEWREGTDPNDPNSHPAYHTKLFLKQVIRTPFGVKFATWNGDRQRPESLEFQINAMDLHQPSHFLKVGDTIPDTKLKLEKFEWKEAWNDKIKEKQEVSELTVVNIESGARTALVVGKVTDVPRRSVIFDYQWRKDRSAPATAEIRVENFQQFGLRPETDKNKLYKLIDIRESEAVIQTPDELEYTVVRDLRQTAR